MGRSAQPFSLLAAGYSFYALFQQAGTFFSLTLLAAWPTFGRSAGGKLWQAGHDGGYAPLRPSRRCGVLPGFPIMKPGPVLFSSGARLSNSLIKSIFSPMPSLIRQRRRETPRHRIGENTSPSLLCPERISPIRQSRRNLPCDKRQYSPEPCDPRPIPASFRPCMKRL